MTAIDSLAATIASQQHALWLGAGISLHSGVPTVGPLRTELLYGLGLSENDAKEYESSNVPFESLFEVLLSTTDCRTLIEVFRGGFPNLAHRVAALLAEKNLVRTIVTTNFDMLIEVALEARGVKFDLFASDSELPSINWESNVLRLIKLHGSIADYDGLGLTVRRVAARQHADIRGNVIRHLLENESLGGLVVLGYSCSDHFDVTPAAKSISRLDRKVLYVSHNESRSAQSSVSLRIAMPNNPFSGFDATCLSCNTSILLENIWRNLSADPIPSSSPIALPWQSIVKSWLDDLRQSQPRGLPSYICGLILKSANLWQKSNKHLKSAIVRGLPPKTTVRTMLAMGNNYFDLGQYTEASTILVEAEITAHTHADIAAEARILNSRGMVAAAENDFDSAIDLYQRALPLSVEAKDRESEGKCYGNLGIAYKNRNAEGDYQRAIDSQVIAKSIAAEIGDKRSEGRTLGNIGLVYRMMNDLPKAFQYYTDARMIAEALGDFLHVGIWLHNAGEDMMAIDPFQAKRLLMQSQEIFMKLEQGHFAKQSETLLQKLGN